MFKLLAAAFLFCLVGCTGLEQQALTAVRLNIPGGVCSGTVVSPTVILTAGHCFEADEEGYTPTVMQVNGYPVKILAVVFDGNDHALVRVDFFFQQWASIGKQLQPGARVHYWGNPAGLNFVYREGYVTGYEHGTMVLDVNGFFGDSGAGLFDENGDVVGTINTINYYPHEGLVFTLMGSPALEFTPLQYHMMGI